MGIRLRQAPSGKLIEGSVTGEILVWNNTTREWDVGPAPTTSTTPLSTTFYVDKGTTVPLADQDGSQAAPFATLAAGLAAVAALPAPNAGTVLVNAVTNDGDYSAEGPLALAATTITIAPIMGAFVRGTYDAAFQGPIIVDEFTVPGGAFHVVTLLGVVATGGGITFAEDGFCLIGAGCGFAGPVACTAPTSGVFVQASDSALPSVTDCADLSNFNNVYFSTGAGMAVSCLGTSMSMVDCTFAPNAITIEFLGAPGTLELDAVSNFWWKAATETLTNGALSIIGDLTP